MPGMDDLKVIAGMVSASSMDPTTKQIIHARLESVALVIQKIKETAALETLVQESIQSMADLQAQLDASIAENEELAELLASTKKELSTTKGKVTRLTNKLNNDSS